MIRMMNNFTHTEMYVAEDRVEEYKAMGHSLMSGSLIATMAKMETLKDIKKPEKTELEKTKEQLKKTVAKTRRKKA